MVRPALTRHQEARVSSLETTLTFELALTFPKELEPDTTELFETIVDAIRDYDDRNRLLPGKPLPLGGERLIGTSIGLTKVETNPDQMAMAPPSDEEMLLGFQRSEAVSSDVINLSVRMDQQIENLREKQADLWTAYNELMTAETESECAELVRKTKRALTKATAALKPADAGKRGGRESKRA